MTTRKIAINNTSRIFQTGVLMRELHPLENPDRNSREISAELVVA
jgi:hypothetical protein